MAHDERGSDWGVGRESVRLRPGMYFGDVGSAGVLQLLLEVVSNAADEFAAGEATTVSVKREGLAYVVRDDGRGFPLFSPHASGQSLGRHYLTTLHRSKTADGHSPHVHLDELQGVGVAAVNAACVAFEVQAWRDGERWTDRFCRGVPVGEPEVVPDIGRGSAFRLEPDPEVFDSVELDWAYVRARMFWMAHLLPGLRVECGAEVFVAPGGLRDMAVSMFECRPGPWSRIIHVRERMDFVQLELALVFQTRAEREVVSFCNGVRTEFHGSHVEGVEAALQAVGLEPAGILVHTVHHEPRFAGPTKRKLDQPEVRSVVQEGLTRYLKSLAEVSEVRRGQAEGYWWRRQ